LRLEIDGIARVGAQIVHLQGHEMHQQAILASLELAVERAGDITPLVYERLFRAQPDMLALFRLDAVDLVKGSMLSHAINVLIDLIGDRQFAEGFIRAESMAHATYDVPPKVFETFYPVLADTVREVLGPDWTAEMSSAWQSAILELSRWVQGGTASTASCSGGDRCRARDGELDAGSRR
jgi:hemoglobin-like flavoprotein